MAADQAAAAKCPDGPGGLKATTSTGPAHRPSPGPARADLGGAYPSSPPPGAAASTAPAAIFHLVGAVNRRA
jgi:hypothetical protein